VNFFGTYQLGSESPRSLMELYNNPDTVQTAPEELLKLAMDKKDYSTYAEIIIKWGIIPPLSRLERVFSALTTRKKNELLDSFGIDQKVALIDFSSEVVKYLIKERPEEVASSFVSLSPYSQALALRECIEKELQIDLLNKLSADQKASVINVEPPEFALSLFSLLSDQERLLIFPYIEPLQQGYFLLHIGNQTSQLFNKLSSQDKKKILDANLNAEEMMNFFLLLSEYDKSAMFSEMRANKQGLLLVSLTPKHSELTNALLGKLSIVEKSGIFV
jgi:Mg/Co/Ni transporter MgtE